jgi:hypothetical protein
VNHIEKDPIQKRIEISNWIVLGVFLVLSLPFMPARFCFGLLLGGLISIVNFHWLDRDLRSVFHLLAGGSRSSIFFKYFIRFIATAVVLYFIVSADIADVVGLLLGLSLVMINIVFTVFMAYSKKNSIEEVS